MRNVMGNWSEDLDTCLVYQVHSLVAGFEHILSQMGKMFTRCFETKTSMLVYTCTWQAQKIGGKKYTQDGHCRDTYLN